MLVFDSSALVRAYGDEEQGGWVQDLMEGDPAWLGSALLAAEVPIAVARKFDNSGLLAEVDAMVREDLNAFRLVPVDSDCLVRAVEIGRSQSLRTLDAIHLSAARALPTEASFVTFDERQREAASALGLKVLRPPV